MDIRILYFASLRERLGRAEERLTLADGTTVAALIQQLRLRGGAWAEAFAEGQAYRVAVEQELASLVTPLGDGQEVAFFPPVTGG